MRQEAAINDVTGLFQVHRKGQDADKALVVVRSEFFGIDRRKIALYRGVQAIEYVIQSSCFHNQLSVASGKGVPCSS